MPYLKDLGRVDDPSPADVVYLMRASGTAEGKVLAGKFIGPGANVRALVEDYTSVTDWGTVINAAVLAGVTSFFFPAGVYNFTTPLDLDDSRLVFFKGEGGAVWFGDNRSQDMAVSALVYQGSGAAAAISARTSSGFTIEDMGVYYDNSGGDFTGDLIDLGGTSATFSAVGCYLGCKFVVANVALQTARSIVCLDNAITATLDRCSIGGAQYCVLGVMTAFSNANRVFNCILFAGAKALIALPGQQWTIHSCTVEIGSNSAAVIDSPFHTITGATNASPVVVTSSARHDLHTGNSVTIAGVLGNTAVNGTWTVTRLSETTYSLNASTGNGSYTSGGQGRPGFGGGTFDFTDCWVGDGDARFLQRPWHTWNAIFSGNYISSPTGPVFQFQGGGEIRLIHNFVSSNDGGVVVDLGDTGAGATAFSHVVVFGNGWVCTEPEAVIHRAGHRNILIDGNSAGAGVLELRTLGGHERIGFPDRWVTPTIAAGADLGSGGAVALADGSTDLGGTISVSPGSGVTAGVMARVTFGTPYVSERLAGTAPMVMLTPAKTVEGVNVGAFVNEIDSTCFDVHVANAPGAGFYLNYRVLGR